MNLIELAALNDSTKNVIEIYNDEGTWKYKLDNGNSADIVAG